MLAQGQAGPQISQATGVLANTIHKAIRLGRLRAVVKKSRARRPVDPHPKRAARRSTSRSPGVRPHAHRRATFGSGGAVCARRRCRLKAPPLGRWAACCGPCQPCSPRAFLRHSRKRFHLPEGFYPLETLFLMLAFMALLRGRSVEALRYEAPD